MVKLLSFLPGNPKSPASVSLPSYWSLATLLIDQSQLGLGTLSILHVDVQIPMWFAEPNKHNTSNKPNTQHTSVRADQRNTSTQSWLLSLVYLLELQEHVFLGGYQKLTIAWVKSYTSRCSQHQQTVSSSQHLVKLLGRGLIDLIWFLSLLSLVSSTDLLRVFWLYILPLVGIVSIQRD